MVSPRECGMMVELDRIGATAKEGISRLKRFDAMSSLLLHELAEGGVRLDVSIPIALPLDDNVATDGFEGCFLLHGRLVTFGHGTVAASSRGGVTTSWKTTGTTVIVAPVEFVRRPRRRVPSVDQHALHARFSAIVHRSDPGLVSQLSRGPFHPIDGLLGLVTTSAQPPVDRFHRHALGFQMLFSPVPVTCRGDGDTLDQRVKSSLLLELLHKFQTACLEQFDVRHAIGFHVPLEVEGVARKDLLRVPDVKFCLLLRSHALRVVKMHGGKWSFVILVLSTVK